MISPFNPRQSLFFFISLAVVIGIFGYGFFEGRRLLSGPRIVIESPLDGSSTSSTMVTLSGTARNISFLTVNGKPAYLDEHGQFLETLSPPPGYAIFTVTASDRFGRQSSKQVHITVLNFCPIVS